MKREITIRKRGGRAEARGAKSIIKSSNIQDKIINNIKKKEIYRTKFSKGELIELIEQASESFHNFPESVAAKKRLEKLLLTYEKYFEDDPNV